MTILNLVNRLLEVSELPMCATVFCSVLGILTTLELFNNEIF